MRFGFFFFAEYVNVFIVSALTVVLFLGGWNAPFACPPSRWPSIRAALGIPLLFLLALGPVSGRSSSRRPSASCAARCAGGSP